MNIHKYHIFFRMKMRVRLYHFTCNCYIILGTSNRIRQDISSCLPIPSVPEIITFYDMSGKEENRNPGEWNGPSSFILPYLELPLLLFLVIL